MPHRIAFGVSMAAILIASHTVAQSQAGQSLAGIVMQINSLKTNEGIIVCDLYATGKGFPNKPDRAISRVTVRPKNNQATCAFTDAKAGRYAVAIWHDVDNDNKLGSNWIGIPSEPVGSSNNAKGRMGPPKFQDAAFDFQPPFVKQAIILE